MLPAERRSNRQEISIRLSIRVQTQNRNRNHRHRSHLSHNSHQQKKQKTSSHHSSTRANSQSQMQMQMQMAIVSRRPMKIKLVLMKAIIKRIEWAKSIRERVSEAYCTFTSYHWSYIPQFWTSISSSNFPSFSNPYYTNILHFNLPYLLTNSPTSTTHSTSQ